VKRANVQIDVIAESRVELRTDVDRPRSEINPKRWRSALVDGGHWMHPQGLPIELT
jgi:hypothetical protein